MLEVRRRRCQLRQRQRQRRRRRRQANQMNAAPFVFCGILFVTRFYHFTCGEAVSTVCMCAGIYLYVCVTFPESDYHICIRQCGGRCCVTGQCDDDDDDDSWAKGMAVAVETENGSGNAKVFFWDDEDGDGGLTMIKAIPICKERERVSTPGLTCDICCKRHFTVQQGLIRIELHTQSGTRPLWLQTLRMTANFVRDASCRSPVVRVHVFVCAGLFMHAYVWVCV